MNTPMAQSPTDGTGGRRTQAERTAHTRALLLDATVASLIELGYPGTSTTEVARRAGVSRGAQTHHFPTKSDLVVAAVEHLFATQERAFRAAFDALPPKQRTLEGALDLLWEIIDGPAYSAILELIVAARTDRELSAVVQGVATGFEAAIRAILGELFPELADTTIGGDLVGFAFATLQGAAISGSVGFFGPSGPTIELLHALARLGVDGLTAFAVTSDAAAPPDSSPTASTRPSSGADR